MTHKVLDRARETTSTTGTGTLTLTGPVPGCIAMADATNGLTADGDTSWFIAENGAEWELFLGTRVDATHLARTAFIKSSTGAAVNFTAPPVVFSTVPAERISAVGPSVRAYLSANQVVTGGVATVVGFNTESFDLGGCFNTATGRFTPNVAGYYEVNYQLSFVSTGTIAANTYVSALHKNGDAQPVSAGAYLNGSPASAASGGTDLVYMNGSTDYLEVKGVCSGTGTISFAGGVSNCRFSAYLAALPGAPMLAPPATVGPVFHAYLSANVTGLTTTTWFKVPLNVTEFDSDAAFDTTLNRFVAPVAGYYAFEWLFHGYGASLTIASAKLHKNGVGVSDSHFATSSAVNQRIVGTRLIYLSAGDYVELFGYLVGTGLASLGGVIETKLSGRFVRA